MPNLKLAVRTLVKAPFVTAVAIGSLALGIGANTAIYSMFHRMLLRPLPVPNPEQLVNLGAPGPKPGGQSCGMEGPCEVVFSHPMFRDIERGQTVLTGVAAHRGFGANLSFHRQAIEGSGLVVSGGYFPVLGIKPSLGRLLGPGDDRTVGGDFAAVLTYHYWATRLGADPKVVGEPIIINGHPFTIVGVGPEGFDGTTLGRRPDVFVPLSMDGVVRPGSDEELNRRSYSLYLFGRLKSGVSIEQAAAGLDRIYRPILLDIEVPLQKDMSAPTLALFKARKITVEAGPRGQSGIGRDATKPLIMLFAVTLIVLLIACINVANLLLARAATRAREMAVRLSLGAGRGQLAAQLLTESLLLAVAAGALSLLVAKATMVLLASFLPYEQASIMGFSLNGSALVFAAVLSLGTGLLFGLVPAIQSTRPELVAVIRADDARGGSSRTHARFRTVMVTAQIGLSMALLSSAALFIRSLANVSRVDLGLKIDNLVTFGLNPELNAYKAPASRVLFRRVEEDLAGVPGVTGVSTAVVAILAGNNWSNDVSVEGFKREPDTDANANLHFVGPGYFSLLSLPVLAGREFSAADEAGGAKVAMVNEAFARKFKLGRDVVGKHLSLGDGNKLDREIVGLVRDAAYSQVKDKVPPQLFLPNRQDTTLGSLQFYVRVGGDPTSVIRAITPLMARIDPALPVSDLKTVPQAVRETLFLDRMISVFSAAFAILATLLAAVGLYGVLAYLVAQRTREIGVRMALGADASRVRGMVLGQVGRMAIVGGVIGTAVAIAAGRAARSMLFGLEGYDPIALGGAALVLGVVAFSAGYLPARRASKVDPIHALRSD